MKKITFTLIMLIFLGLIGNSQIVTFQKTFGGTNTDEVNYVKQTFDEGYVFTGRTQSGIAGSAWDVFLIKTDQFGNMLWNKTYGNTASESANCIQQTSDGGYILAGETSDAGFSYGFLIKTNSLGDTSWIKKYGSYDAQFATVRQTVDEGYIAGGYHNLFRTDNLGNLIWAKSYADISINDVQEMVSGNFIVGGSNINIYEAVLFEINTTGDIVWSKIYPFHGIKSIRKTDDGGYILAGQFGNSSPLSACFLKIDTVGNVIWAKKYSIAGSNIFSTSVEETDDNGFIALIRNPLGLDMSVLLTLKMDSLGNFLWSKSYQSEYCDALNIQETGDGGFVFAGWRGNTSSSHDIYLVKTDSSGQSGCYESPYLLSFSDLTCTATSATIITTSVTGVAPLSLYVNNIAFSENTLCSTVEVEQNFVQNEEIIIYPNPASEFFCIKLDGLVPNQISLFDCFGRLVLAQYLKEQPKEDTFVFKLNKVSSGIYTVKITTNNGVFARKVMVE